MNRLVFPELFSKNVTHGFFGRQGGVSTSIFDSLNCSPQSGDDMRNVLENRQRVLKALGGDKGGCDDLLTLKQIHSAECHFVGNKDIKIPEDGDALATDQPGRAIGALTADCAPVLLEGRKGNGASVIGAAHAGWGGALKGVCERTIDRMEELGAIKQSIRAIIGPCIAMKSYQVGFDFSAPFIEEDPASSRFFESRMEKLYFDLPSYVGFRLQRAGVSEITVAGLDTYTLEQDYFSFRRSTHRNEMQYGRQISAISIIKT
ncbi:MAG: peptidoglycan editing factor PgeF [Alphaproteobacteria bacterium]|nr:peptidoglycan editing factor PgeF [Alphaproteobacteria bacterium]MCB1551843.1 peptidoglycan editing factor PgeF [Alphaproteobacteria bacterium]MCB9984432.1 peptidoglycan editing factor PgeF [Micavibrio sp.]HRK97803.1 peptidoglycan editing factor PgeF [Alphaproteobacteria bacterium]